MKWKLHTKNLKAKEEKIHLVRLTTQFKFRTRQCKLNSWKQQNRVSEGGWDIYQVEIVVSRPTLRRPPQGMIVSLKGTWLNGDHPASTFKFHTIHLPLSSPIYFQLASEKTHSLSRRGRWVEHIFPRLFRIPFSWLLSNTNSFNVSTNDCLAPFTMSSSLRKLRIITMSLTWPNVSNRILSHWVPHQLSKTKQTGILCKGVQGSKKKIWGQF